MKPGGMGVNDETRKREVCGVPESGTSGFEMVGGHGGGAQGGTGDIRGDVGFHRSSFCQAPG